jgi:peptidyl-prolyl cis-trans isomerase SurA
MSSKSIRMLALVAALVALARPAWPQTRELGATGELLDGVAAVVDTGVVLRSELAQRLAIVVANLRETQGQLPPEQRRPLPPLSVLEGQVLDQLIVRQLQLQRAESLGITVGDEMLNQALASIAQGFNLTFQQLPDALAADGIDYAMYRQDTREQLILEQLEQRDVVSRIAVAPREMDLCLSRLAASATDELDYNVSHLLIGLSSSASREDVDAARRRVEEIYGRLEAGEDFAQLAVQYSDGQTALEGGALGWRKGSQLPTLFRDVVIGMQPGEHSQPIQSGSGFHIVRLNEARGAEPVMVDQLRARHILVTPNEILDDAASEQKLRGIREQLLDGEDFATLARAMSEDTVSAADGGDLGWVQPGDFVPEFEQTLAGLEVGAISEPFRTRYGWHLAQVTEKRSFDTTEDLKRQRCASEIRATKAEEERELWLRRLRDEAYVEILI